MLAITRSANLAEKRYYLTGNCMKRKTKFKKLLPKIEFPIANGSLCEQKVRCGKPNCRCAKGQLHEGYFYFFSRIRGKLRKWYIPKNLVEEFKEKLENEIHFARYFREIDQFLAESLKNSRAILRANETSIKDSRRKNAKK